MTTEENFHARPPLGLPTGSVRAVLTLLILAVVVHEIVLGRLVAVIWTETLVIALAYYLSMNESERSIRISPVISPSDVRVTYPYRGKLLKSTFVKMYPNASFVRPNNRLC